MKLMIPPTFVIALAGGLALAGSRATGQTAPPNGMHPGDLRLHAIVDAAVVVAPGERFELATVVIRDGVIEQVGPGVQPPPGARIWSGAGLTVYPGLIDAAVLVDTEPRSNAGAHWNPRVHPELAMIDEPAPAASLRRELRDMGFTAAAFYPRTGVLRGTGVVLALAEDDDHVLSYRDRAAMAFGFDHGRGFGGRTYPGSLMGAIALLRQTLYDARWYAACRRVWESSPEGREPPIRADALAALGPVVDGRQSILFDVDDEQDALRATRIAREFALDMVLLGSGYEFRRVDDIAAAGFGVIVPLSFPDRPDVSAPGVAERVTLRALLTWEQAPSNPRRLIDAGATMALTTQRLEKRSSFAKALREAIRYGLSEDEALAALTITPATMLGLGDLLGTVEAGKAANLVVVEGSLFDKKGTIRATWVNGRRHEVSRPADPSMKIAGTLRLEDGTTVGIRVDPDKPSVRLVPDEGKPIKAAKTIVQGRRLSFVVEGTALGVEGYVQFGGALTGGRLAGSGVRPDGSGFAFVIEPGGADPDAAVADESDEDEDEANEEDPPQLPPDQLVQPLGAYGRLAPPEPQDVVITNATLWTCGPEGVIAGGSMYVREGRIEWIGAGAAPAPAGVAVIDAGGKHVTPGLIDCHSHTGIDGGVNEFNQANTAEVRISDVVDPDDIGWYRELAGGLVACNQLHGSANPIGGQNSVVKLKWGRGADDFPIADAIGGIKFALGENVKRTEGRYPDTRMGVETFIRDAFTAATAYRAEWDTYLALSSERRQSVYPPRRDIEMDALVEVIDGDRLIHCHSYRQDEILMMIRVADAFGFTMGTFQHVLEGYKVAEALAAHGAGASTFSDWWAYKVEVMDAIPFNGTLMSEVGVNVSFNSDSNELARRMNTEAAKAVRYGGMTPADALHLVTINPARQLEIDHRTGSLEIGKDADFVVWSGDPLSTYTRCEQTWIEGARYFDLDDDRHLRAEAEQERTRLIQKVLVAAHGKPGDRSGPDDESDAPTGDTHDVPTAIRDRLAEMIRRGEDPGEIRPGVCGCDAIGHAAYGEEGR